MAIDYGLRRTGLAVTDPLQIIATGLTTVDSRQLMAYLKNYFATEVVEKIIIGFPVNLDDSATHATPLVERCIRDLRKQFPSIPVEKVDERFTSAMARQSMLDMGLRRKARRNKGLVDEIAATILLQEYLQHRAG